MNEKRKGALHPLGRFDANEVEPCPDDRPRGAGQGDAGGGLGGFAVQDPVLVVILVVGLGDVRHGAGDHAGLILRGGFADDVREAADEPQEGLGLAYEELQAFPLLSSQERIPLLADVLAAVNGRVPLIIEIKVHEKAEEVCARADELIAAYKGPYCIESFHPSAVIWYKKNRPEVIRGQLSTSFNLPKRPEPFLYVLLHYLLTNVSARPDFIAYDHHHKNNISRVLCRKVFGVLSVAWTLKSQQELEACKKDFDLFIFEQFIPRD